MPRGIPEVQLVVAASGDPEERVVGQPDHLLRRRHRRRALVGGFDERYPNAMDYDFFLRAFAQGKRFLVIPETLTRMAGGGQSERSLWRTLRETHAIRARTLTHGWERSYVFFLFLFARGWTRRVLQRVGLGGPVAWLRRRFAMAPKA